MSTSQVSESARVVLDPVEVRQQLERLLASPHIRNSKRSQALLKFVVEAYLEGSLDRIKERVIGVEVFHRDPDYDTNEDSVVRTTALEIRKRLAQYYSEPGHEQELRVLLPAGSYAPDFRLPTPVPPPTPAPLALPVTVPVSLDLSAAAGDRTYPAAAKKSPWIPIAAFALFALALAAVIWPILKARPTDLDRFWAPLMDDRAEAVICIEQPLRIYRFEGPRYDDLNRMMVGNSTEPALSDDARQTAAVKLSELRSAGDRYFAIDDMMASLRLVELLSRRGKPFQVLGDRATSYHDLRGHPAVLIGEFNNKWTAGLASGLRYYLDKDPVRRLYLVRDRQAHGAEIASTTSEEKRPEEYVVISRIFPASTEKMVIAVSSMTFRGNGAGGDFLTNAAYLHDALKDAPSGWEKRNLQVVLKATLVSGMAGPPKVIATYYW